MLEIVDPEGRKVEHNELFFYGRKEWKEAEERYVKLQHAAQQMRRFQWVVAREMAWFIDKKKSRKQPCIDRWRVAEEANSFWSFAALLGFSANKAKFYARIGEWGMGQKLEELVAGLDMDMLDVLRKAREEDLVDLFGIAQHGKPGTFWEEIDRRKVSKKTLRSFVASTGKVRLLKAENIADIELEEGEKLIRGTLVIGGEGVRDEEGRHGKIW